MLIRDILEFQIRKRETVHCTPGGTPISSEPLEPLDQTLHLGHELRRLRLVGRAVSLPALVIVVAHRIGPDPQLLQTRCEARAHGTLVLPILNALLKLLGCLGCPRGVDAVQGVSAFHN